jgi:C1A family cysteine protease
MFLFPSLVTEIIEAHNQLEPKPSFKLGHNEYSDMTNDEFQQHFNLGKYSNIEAQLAKEQTQKLVNGDAASVSARYLEEQAPLQIPDEVNWIALGGVTDVKNQGACGSCWAFSTTGALEGAKFVHTGELVALSEQHLLDCDHKDLGCRGGLMDNAFKFDQKTGGLCSEEDYPYEAKQGRVCNPNNCTEVPGTIVNTFYDVPPGDPKTLMAALSMQPVSVAIQANQFVFQFYKEGVLTDDSCGKSAQLDHGVLAVGYGNDNETGEPFFMIKNSWGDKWGENGYIRMSRKSKNEYGMCGVLKMASYPVVK